VCLHCLIFFSESMWKRCRGDTPPLSPFPNLGSKLASRSARYMRMGGLLWVLSQCATCWRAWERVLTMGGGLGVAEAADELLGFRPVVFQRR